MSAMRVLKDTNMRINQYYQPVESHTVAYIYSL